MGYIQVAHVPKKVTRIVRHQRKHPVDHAFAGRCSLWEMQCGRFDMSLLEFPESALALTTVDSLSFFASILP
jgi:hypothetical protein